MIGSLTMEKLTSCLRPCLRRRTLTSFLPCMDVRRTWTHTSIMLLIYPQILGWFLIYKPAGNGQRHRPAMSIVHVYTKPASSFAYIAILPPDVYNTDK